MNDEAALLWMVNMGCIDMNAWYSRVPRLDRPDFVLFDLDPSEGVPFDAVVETALLVKDVLDALGLASFPKTSSLDGMHVIVPIARRATYDDTRRFAEMKVQSAFARQIPYVVYFPRLTFVLEFMREFNLAVEYATRGRTTPAAALQSAEARVNEIIRREGGARKGRGQA